MISFLVTNKFTLVLTFLEEFNVMICHILCVMGNYFGGLSIH